MGCAQVGEVKKVMYKKELYVELNKKERNESWCYVLEPKQVAKGRKNAGSKALNQKREKKLLTLLLAKCSSFLDKNGG